MNPQLRQRLLIKRRQIAMEAATNWIEEIRKQPPADREFVKRLLGR